MKTVTFFNTEEELQELTGLDHDGLWENGFDLDDLAWGFASDTYWDPYDYKNKYAYWLLHHMHSYTTYYKANKYNGKYYYMYYYG